ncbi:MULTISPECIES: prenyltransferase [Arsenicicoccus]|uniref:prenyltransferase n=1 Tax=Arsenicicoccus TaxID=267408 RepID=UPI00257ED1A4|nr:MULTISPECIES: prenyltransferase [Arsenicicoccus]
MSQQSQQSRLGRLVASSRPLSWVNTAYPFGAAYLLTAGRLDLRAVVGIVFFLVPYNLLMYGVNDVFDYESDLRNPRKGGVEGIVLDRSLHRLTLWAAVLLPVPFVLWLLAHGSLAAGIVLAVSVAAVVAYSAPGLRFKERAFVDSMTSSTHFVSPAVYGVVLAGVALPWQGWVVLLAYFLWGMASHAFGAVQDVTADRAAGIGSVATVIGAQATVRLSAGLYAATGLLLATTGRWGLLAALLVLPYLWMVWPYRSLSDEEAPRANGGWRRFLWINYVVGFLLTQLLIARWLVG